MKNLFFLFTTLLCFIFSYSQKKPLDHSVYNSWQSIGERMISNNGNWVVYTIDVQEGDNELVIQSSDAKYKKIIPRGYNALITGDNRFVIFKIKPFYTAIREAAIKKKKDDEKPKDSLAIIELGKEETWKAAGIKSFKTPRDGEGWVAYQLEKKTTGKTSSNKRADSLLQVIDSLKNVINISQRENKKNKDRVDADYADDEKSDAAKENGSDVVLHNLLNGAEKKYSNVLEYYFSKQTSKLLLTIGNDPKDSLSKQLVLLYDLIADVTDTLSRGGNDFKNFAMTDDGSQVAYVAERDSKPKELQRFYKLWYYKSGMDSAIMLADKNAVGLKVGMTVSEYGTISFSKTGERLFFGVSPVQPPKDTSLADIDLVKLDIWHYKDDYLQTVQLKRLEEDLKKNYLAVYDFNDNRVKQLGSPEMPQVIQTDEGDGDTFVGITDFGKRIESQWTGATKDDVYAITVKTGQQQLIKEDLNGMVYPSSTGKYILWYDREKKNYFVWDGNAARNITEKIKVPLYNEENDLPNTPVPYGVMGWSEGDSTVFVYDRYDVWKADLIGKREAINIFQGSGRINKITYRYHKTDPDEQFLPSGKELVVEVFDHKTKGSDLALLVLGNPNIIVSNTKFTSRQYRYSDPLKARDSLIYVYTKENFLESPDVYTNKGLKEESRLSFINPQQQNYNWVTAELFKWKAYNGKEATGIVYKPENFDPKKKYPLICYFYEKLSDNLNRYIPPAPIRSAINVTFFVSRGYIIFMPDIEYQIGHPGKSAYNYIVSGARALVKKGFIDSTNMAIQGHSWGGYQAAQLVTMTKMFKAAWAGAPVANMTSAYGGIRWESGLNRQYQYEKTQSRIGATLWDKPQLYIENSPLFHLKNVTTPLVIMHNDADGAVPWYQGIELFTAMRRLNKKVWMFNYNGQGHGLTQRKDKLDYHIRMQQFFDWILKGEKPVEWITDGLPAVKKGRDWGME
jgi:dipeptidyl aminopeptidase/acylaminoacyl peptidase